MKENLISGLRELYSTLSPNSEKNKENLGKWLNLIQNQTFSLKGVKGEELRNIFDAIQEKISKKDYELLEVIENNIFGADERNRNFPEDIVEPASTVPMIDV